MTHMLPNDTLEYEIMNTEGQENKAFDGAVALLEKGVVGIVGTGYSSALRFPGVYCSSKKKPIVSPGSTALSLHTRAPLICMAALSL